MIKRRKVSNKRLKSDSPKSWIWKALRYGIAVFAFIISLVVFWPQITVSPAESLNAANAYSATLVFTNVGQLGSAYHIEYQCGYPNRKFSAGQWHRETAWSELTVVKAKLDPGMQLSFECPPGAISILYDNGTRLIPPLEELTVIVRYRPFWYFPQIKRRPRFAPRVDDSGRTH